VLLVAVTLAAYVPVWQAGFIWDDDTFLWHNPLIQSPGGLWRLWLTSAAPDYFPLTSTTLWLEWRLWGANPLGYHLVNVLLHAFSAVLMWRVLRRLRIPGAVLAAAIFAVHPVNVESVAWITERKNTLAMFFYLLSVLLFLRSEDGTKTRMEDGELRMEPEPSSILHPPSSLLYCLSLLAFACALLSKTAAAPLPLVLLGLAWWRRGRLGLKDLWRSLPFFGLAAASALVTLWFQYHRAIGASLLDVRNDSFWARLAGAGWAIWFYLYKAALPLHLSFVYPRWCIDASRVWVYLPGVLALAVFLFAWWFRRSWGKSVLLAWGYFVLMLLPVLGFVSIYFMRYSLVADHWQYFAIIGPIALGAAAITWACGQGNTQHVTRSAVSVWLAPAVGGALVLLLGVLTWREALTYRDLKTLWTATVSRNPSAGLAHNNLGSLLLAEGHVNEAIVHFEKALAVEPKAADVHSNLGGALLQRGQLQQAMAEFQKAIALQPDSALAHNNLGNALSRQGRIDGAIAEFQKAVEFQPALASARCNLGSALLQAGRLDQAILQLQLALELQPDLADAYLNLGDALLAKGQVNEAVSNLRKAVELQPSLASACYSLGNALLQQGRADEAAAHFQKALALEPGFAPAHNGLANVLLQKGQANEALAHYREALRLDPQFAEAHLNLANLFLQSNQVDDAIAEFKAALKLQPGLAAAHNNLANALFGKGRVDEAISHFQEALRLQPNLAEAQNGLANALLRKGRVAEAVKHYQAAVTAVPNHPYLLNNLAWVLATCPDASIRNGAQAVQLAQQAEQLSGGKDPVLLGTLAAAYAEIGQFKQAVATAQRALEVATAQTNAPQAETLRARLKLYESGSPFRDSELSSR
jgi:tetratricopeptide (TPR) repeat protein